MSSEQLPLPFRLAEGLDLDSFVAGPNQGLVEMLSRQPAQTTYLQGGAGCGKSHLLQALCGRESESGRPVAYLPLIRWRDLSPAVCEGLEAMCLVCVDDIDAVAGEGNWETALFHLYNRLRDAGNRWLAAGRARVADTPYSLPDLASRLQWGAMLRLRPLADTDRGEVLRRRARQRGLELPEEVAGYLLTRHDRDLGALCRLLDRLDRASLSRQRRLTVPFVREILGEEDTRAEAPRR